MSKKHLLILASLPWLLTSCPKTDNAGAIYDPSSQTGGGGNSGGGGGGVKKGPSGAPVAGAQSVAGAPTVTSVEPKGTNNSVETPVCVLFNESVQLSTVNTGTLLLRVQGGTSLASTISSFAGGRFFVLLPSAPLPTNRTIEVVASNLIRDLDGLPLTVPSTGIIGSFQTEVTADAQKVPRVVASFPPNNANNVSPGTATYGSGASAFAGTPTQVITVFSEPVAPSSILGNLTVNPPLEGLSLTQVFDPDGPTGPQPPAVTVLIPGSGAFLQPETTNRIWTATPGTPFKPGSQVLHRVGTGVTNDDVNPVNLAPAFQSIFNIAALEPPQFVNIVTENGLTTAPASLNNAPPPAQNSAGAFTVGVAFPASSVATDDVEIQLHDLTSTGSVLFKRKAAAGGLEAQYGGLSIFGKSGLSLLKDPTVVIAARTKRGNVTSPWTVGPPVTIDTVVPTVASYGPPAVGPLLYCTGRIAAIYGQATETPTTMRFLSIESPQGTPLPVPEAPFPGKLLMTTKGNFFSSYPLVPTPEITATPGTPPQEPVSRATFILGDNAGNESNALTVAVRARGRVGGPSLSTQNALTVLVYDEDTLVEVNGALVVVDEGLPSGTLAGQRKKTTSPNPLTGVSDATFLTGLDLTPGTSQVSVTVTAPGYGITSVIGCPLSFLSIPIQKIGGTPTTNPPTLTVAPQGASTGQKLDCIVNARPDLADRWVIPSSDAGLVPAFPPFTVAASRVIYPMAFVKAADAFAFTYVNDAFGFPVAPINLGGSSTTTITFGQSYGQTATFDDDPVQVPPAGSVPATLPGTPFNNASLSGVVEVTLTVPGARVGVIGQIPVGEGRAGNAVGGLVSVANSFDPKVNTTGLFKKVDSNTNALVVDPVDPMNFQTDVRIGVRVEDSEGNVSRALALATSTNGSVTGIGLPVIPAVQPSTPASGGLLAPKVWWNDTNASMYVVHLVITSGSTSREWRLYTLVGGTDQSQFGKLGLQLPNLTGLGSEGGAPLPVMGSLVKQYVDGITLPQITSNGWAGFFFDDLRFSAPLPGFDADLRFARSKKVEIIY